MAGARGMAGLQLAMAVRSAGRGGPHRRVTSRATRLDTSRKCTPQLARADPAMMKSSRYLRERARVPAAGCQT